MYFLYHLSSHQDQEIIQGPTFLCGQELCASDLRRVTPTHASMGEEMKPATPERQWTGLSSSIFGGDFPIIQISEKWQILRILEVSIGWHMHRHRDLM